jgi:hypothetical protein
MAAHGTKQTTSGTIPKRRTEAPAPTRGGGTVKQQVHPNDTWRPVPLPGNIEDITYDPMRGINKAQILNLATCEYVKKGESLVISGSIGCGKRFMASAHCHQACMHGHTVVYSNTQKFMQETKMAKTDGTILKYFVSARPIPYWQSQADSINASLLL